METGTSKRERVNKEREKRFARLSHVILRSLDFIYIELLTLPRYVITHTG